MKSSWQGSRTTTTWPICSKRHWRMSAAQMTQTPSPRRTPGAPANPHGLAQELWYRSHCDVQPTEAEMKHVSTAFSLWSVPKEQFEAAAAVAAPAKGVFCRLFHLARPDWIIMPFAFLAVLLASVMTPAQAFFFNQGIISLYEVDEEGLELLDKACLGLALVGLASGASVLIQNGVFTYMQESLVLTLRKRAFASTICMDMSFFDAPENQVASILVSLERRRLPFCVDCGEPIGCIFVLAVLAPCRSLGSFG
ncbi:unnamed protein product [Effrenium voratum]|nr:unnamed protein product [Effrenium voratum]